jgi:hypothetical protein
VGCWVGFFFIITQASMNFNKEAELNVLINLAAIDSIMDAKEVNLIHMIGKANGITKLDIDKMIASPQTILKLDDMTEDEKFEHLYYLVLMMKADGRVLRNEIDFCELIAVRLGYRKGVIGAISKHVYSDIAVHSDRQLLRMIAEQYANF